MVSVTSDVLGVHAPLVIVQRKVADDPATKPVTEVEYEDVAVIVPVPDTRLHAPVPVAGIFPKRLVVVKLQRL